MVFNTSLVTKVNLMAGATKFKVTRPTKVVYEEGLPVRGEPICFNAIGNVQPVIGKELLMVPEGERLSQHFFVFTRNRLFVEDVINWNGKDHEIRMIEDWGPYIKCRMILIDVS